MNGQPVHNSEIKITNPILGGEMPTSRTLCAYEAQIRERGEGRERGHKDGENREELSLSAFPAWSDGIERNVLPSSRNNTDLFSIPIIWKLMYWQILD